MQIDLKDYYFSFWHIGRVHAWTVSSVKGEVRLLHDTILFLGIKGSRELM